MQLGLCCQFYEHPIKYRSATVKYAKTQGQEYLAAIYTQNIEALLRSLQYCFLHGIHAFRVSSDLFPLATHADFKFDPATMSASLFDIRGYADKHKIALSLHPDQFIVLNSPKPDVVANSIRDLTYQAQVAEMLGTEQITLHAGGVYADKQASLKRLIHVVNELPSGVRRYLSFENDDKSYTPTDIASICAATGCRFIYDVHHHRFNADGLSVEEATAQCKKYWHRVWQHLDGWVHISSSREGTSAHSDFIKPEDFPASWKNENIVVDVEAKAKEVAVLTLKRAL
jgi:UV DNA damage endonuclease